MPHSSSHSLFALLALVGGLLLLPTGCDDGQATEQTSESRSRPAVRVETYRLLPTSFTDVIEITGSVEALEDATLSSQTDGTVTTIHDLGARVRQGEPVATINAEEAQAAVEQARAQYELTQDRFERQQPLYRDSVISALEFEQVRSERNQARSALEQAEKRLDNTRVVAPFSGTVEERFVEVGEQASPGTRVARLVNTRQVKVTAGVPERYANDIRVGTPVQLDFRRYDAGLRTAEVTFVGSTIDPDSRTFTIEATISNENRTLKTDMGANVRVTRAVLDSALVLPRTAVIRDEAGAHVYVAEESDSLTVARKRDVVLGPEAGAQIVAESGLSAGDEIIIVGQNNVSPGTPLEIAHRHDELSGAGTPYGAEDSLPAPPTN